MVIEGSMSGGRNHCS